MSTSEIAPPPVPARGAVRPPLNAPPRSVPGAAVVAVLTALALVGVGVVAIYDLAVRQGWTGSSSTSEWLASAVDGVDGLAPTWWVLAVAAVLGLLGLYLLLLTVRPARTRHARATGETDGVEIDLWTSPGAAAALARNAADRAPGVIAAETVRVSRRRVQVAVTTHREPGEVKAAAERAARAAAGPLSPARIDVVTKEVPR